VAYAKERVQFGSPIGSFQAVKHMCADMLVAAELATAAWDAARALASGGPEAEFTEFTEFAAAVAADVALGAFARPLRTWCARG
jgi:alkylation response protein AidB-like acyl-CoA dehydrogenase